MSRRRSKPASGWGKWEVCPACGGRLLWAFHKPNQFRRVQGEEAKRLPFDAEPTDDVTARYAVKTFGHRESRYLGPTYDPTELDLHEARHHPHLGTCPAGVTVPQLRAPIPATAQQGAAARRIGS